MREGGRVGGREEGREGGRAYFLWRWLHRHTAAKDGEGGGDDGSGYG